MIGVILAQGKGLRLRPITRVIPKNLIVINGKPIIEHQIDYLHKYGINNVYVITSGYEKVWENFRKSHDVTILSSPEPLGTAGCLTLLNVSDDMIVMNGDVLTTIDLNQLIRCDQQFIGCISLVKMRSPYGIVKVEKNYVVSFEEKPLLPHLINAGVYYFRPDVLDLVSEGDMFEDKVLPMLASLRLLGFVNYDNVEWRSIDSTKDIESSTRPQ
ncbi:MAG: nucleotidyltransferase family protein [Metallosphaera sp.]|uniref:nucleotidyltransferase family protein n=1 Tax=Metallosphaera sp. TaxID=2020860 RepID=UPI00315E5468